MDDEYRSVPSTEIEMFQHFRHCVVTMASNSKLQSQHENLLAADFVLVLGNTSS